MINYHDYCNTIISTKIIKHSLFESVTLTRPKYILIHIIKNKIQ